MKKNQMQVIVLMPREVWHIVKILAPQTMILDDDNTVRPCTGSDIIRELVDEWLDEQSFKQFPILLKKLEREDIHHMHARTIIYLRKKITEYVEYLVFNKMQEVIQKFKKSMLDAGFTESEFEEIMKEAKESIKNDQDSS